MQRDAAGRPTEAPIMILIAKNTGLDISSKNGKQERRTDVTPYWRTVYHVVRPDDGVDALIQACQCGPHHVVTCPGIPGVEVPRKRDQDEDESCEGEDGEKRVGWVVHWSGSVGGREVARTNGGGKWKSVVTAIICL